MVGRFNDVILKTKKFQSSVVFEGVSALLIAGMVLFAALARGGDSSWARLGLISVAAGLAIMLMIGREGVDKGARPWLLVWLGSSIWIGIQSLPGMGAVLGAISASNCGVPAGCAGLPVSPNPINTGMYWALFSVYWLLAWGVSGLPSRHVRFLLGVIALVVAFEALYGVWVFLAGQETILWIWEKGHYLRDATGSFVNRNHYAGYLALVSPVVLSLIFSRSVRLARHVENLYRIWFAVVLVSLVVIAVVGSHSRLGFTSLLIGLTVWGIGFARRQGGGKSRLSMVAGLYFVMALAAVWFGMEVILRRFDYLPDDQRFVVWAALREFPLSAWLWGVGAGAFEDAYMLILPAGVQGRFAELHNDWLEFIISFGLLGSLLVGGLMLNWWRKVRPRRFSLLQLGAMSGIVAIMVHSLGDFNLQIPGVAVTFWVLVGVMVNPNIGSGSSRARKPDSQHAEG